MNIKYDHLTFKMSLIQKLENECLIFVLKINVFSAINKYIYIIIIILIILIQKVGANHFKKIHFLSVKSRLVEFCEKRPNGYESRPNGY